MALTPPSQRIWWNEPVARVELVWITVAFLWGLVMFFMMIYWHGAGKQNLSNEAYRITAEGFQVGQDRAMIARPVVVGTVVLLREHDVRPGAPGGRPSREEHEILHRVAPVAEGTYPGRRHDPFPACRRQGLQFALPAAAVRREAEIERPHGYDR